MPNLRDLKDAQLAGLVSGMCLAAAGVAIQTASAVTYKTTNTVAYTVDGVLKSKAAAATQSLITNSFEGYTAAQMTVPFNSTGYFVVALNAAGTVKNFAGVATAPNGTFAFTGKLPNIPVGWTPVGYIKVVTGSTAFVPGTTALDATTGGMAITFADVAVLPMTESP